MHNIHYIEVEEKADRKKTLARIEDHASRDGDGYSSRVKWHDEIEPLESREAAEEKIGDLDNGWYDDHAVRFYDYSKAVTTKKIDDIKKRITDLTQKIRDYEKAHSVLTYKAEFIGCSKCGSKISKKFLYSDHCPVCHADMRSETTRKTLSGYKKKLADLYDQIEVEKKKQKNARKVMWLVKYEYHS